MFFVGIDLAWSTNNGSGVSIFKGDKERAEFVCGEVVFSDDDIINYINENVGDEPAFVSIDAPLIVPNESGRRVAEEVVGALFRKYDAGAHPANRKRLSQWTGRVRGEDIASRLEKEGFVHDPTAERFEESRKFFEVYPHPSMVALFDMDRILRYKKKPGRDYDFLWDEFRKYQDYLKKMDPPIKLPKEIIEKDMSDVIGKELKEYEDLLDSIFCAYLCYYLWTNPGECKVLGSMEEGYIMTPLKKGMESQLKEINSQKNLSSFS